MKNELKFDQRDQFRVLSAIFSMFKYGVDDEDKKIMILSSPVFKEMFDSIYKSYMGSIKNSILDNFDSNEFIEDKPHQFEILKHYLKECKKGISYMDDFKWDRLNEKRKREYIVNLSSPFLIREETILALLKG
jgi:hypothetical protein